MQLFYRPELLCSPISRKCIIKLNSEKAFPTVRLIKWFEPGKKTGESHEETGVTHHKWERNESQVPALSVSDLQKNEGAHSKTTLLIKLVMIPEHHISKPTAENKGSVLDNIFKMELIVLPMSRLLHKDCPDSASTFF